MLFISAGHNSQSKTIKRDPGAVNKDGIKEGDLTIDFRNLITAELDRRKIPYISDTEEENLSMYLKRIKTGSGSVVIEFHFDSSTSSKATGCTAIIETEADRLDRFFAKEIVDVTSKVLGIANRGVISEGQSNRGRLGLMREEGIICLLELGFISNYTDICAYHTNKVKLAQEIVTILYKYERMI